jgi:ornithine cyclodeaminase/alanine dehydrogenase-like protein (mu-crystallin family)
MSSFPIYGAADLRAALDLEALIEPVGRALREASRGLAQDAIATLWPGAIPEDGDVYVKSACVRGHAVYVVKVSPWFAATARRGEAQGGFLAVFDAADGRTVALLEDAHYLSDLRTAAAGALAARALAPARVHTVGVLGTGSQAYWQVRAVATQRPFARLVAWGRTPARVHHLLERLRPALPDVALDVAPSPRAVVEASEVVITATSARDPLIAGEWLRPGQHLTAVGADDPLKCELDASCLRRAERLIVDSRAANLALGDVHRAVALGELRAEDVHGELGAVLAGACAGRRADAEVTIAKLVGVGVQDLAAAEVALERLRPP